MARSRNIKPGFFTNDELAECSPFARLLFAGLWTIADKEGRLDDRPKKVKAMVLPFDDVDCNDLLQQLHNHKFINRYQVNNEPYIQINNWKKHQNPHCKEAASEIPEPAKTNESTGQEQCKSDDDPEKEAAGIQQVIENEGAPDKHSSSTVLEQEQHTTNPADSLNLIPDSLILIPFLTPKPLTRLAKGSRKKALMFMKSQAAMHSKDRLSGSTTKTIRPG